MAKKMNNIEKLIAELCPEGVEWKDVGTLIEDKAVTTVNPPKKLTKKYYKPIGAFPIIDQGQNFIVGYTDDSKALVTNGLYVIFGDHTEAIKYVDFAFAQGADGIKVLKTHTDIINTRFFYYALNDFYKKTGKYTRHFSFLKKTEIPIPPLSIQQEIVNILDTFTTLEAELETELETELEARKKQYEYYRKELLTFGEDVEWKTLGGVAKNLDSKRKPVTKRNRKEGEYPYYGASGIVDYVSDYIFDGDYLLVSEDGANLLARVTPIAFSASGKIWVNNHAHVLEFETYAEKKFVEYYLNMIDLSRFISTAAQPKLTQDNLNKIPIPRPLLAEQERIVTILDEFDTLVNDISIGLPAELNARRKQYEYYRGKLLTFKPLEEEYVNQ